MEEDELLDLVNDRDEVIGTVYRNKYDHSAAGKKGYIRAVELFIQNDEGEFWIPKRTAHKVIAPNGLDYSAGGHVGSGQTYLEAMIHETEDELNLVVQPDDLIFVHKFQPGKLPYFRCLYFYRSNKTPEFNPDDFVSADWLSFDELTTLLEQGIPAKIGIHEAVLKLRELGYS